MDAPLCGESLNHMLGSTAEIAKRYGEESEAIIGAAIEVHRTIGPGLLKSAYRHWSVVVEIKSVGHVTPLHEAQLLTYLNMGWKVGLLINFNVPLRRSLVSVLSSKFVEQVGPCGEPDDIRLAG
jgi:hypothetical protein